MDSAPLMNDSNQVSYRRANTGVRRWLLLSAIGRPVRIDASVGLRLSGNLLFCYETLTTPQ